MGKWINPFLLMIISMTVHATSTATKYWFPFTLNGNYGKFVYQIEPQLRLIESDNYFNQMLVNAGGGRSMSPHWELWLGGTSTTTSQDAAPSDMEEYRLWEQIIWKTTLANDWKILSRTRVEERKSVSFSELAYRGRERLWLTIPVAANLSLVFSDELLVNLNDVVWISTKTLDQNRVYLGVTQSLTNVVSVNISYLNQYIFTSIPQADNGLVLNFQFNLAT